MPGLFAEKHKGVFPRSTYRNIRRCLHTDRTASEAWMRKAWDAFTETKLLLVKPDKPPPEPLSPWQQQEREAMLRRAAQRQARQQAKAKPKAGGAS